MSCSSKKSLWEIMIPETKNDGEDFSKEVGVAWARFVVERAGGATVLNTVSGWWKNPEGLTIVENMTPILVACTEEDILAIVEETRRAFEQESVMFWRVSDDVRFHEKTASESQVVG